MLDTWNTNFSAEMMAFFGQDVTVHQADSNGQPDPAPDGAAIRVIRQPERRGDVNTFQNIYREAVSLVTNDVGNADKGKFVNRGTQEAPEYWFISSVSELGWGWTALSVNKGDC